MWHNSIATYIDADGDGRVEKWIRGNAAYFDDDGDGTIDSMLENKDEYDGAGAIYDTDGDGYFDSWYADTGTTLTKMNRRVLVPDFPDPRGLD